MDTFVLLTVTGLALGAMYFLIASGLSLIYGLMGVLNFAHGAFITVGTYATWYAETKLGVIGSAPLRFVVAAIIGLAAGAVLGALVEIFLIRPLYLRHIEQALVTVGLSLVLIALVQAIWGPTERIYPTPKWLYETTSIFGAQIPNDRFFEIAAAIVVLLGLLAFLRFTRYGLIIRAGFAIGGVAAALAGVLAGVYYGSVDPAQGTSLLIFAFIVTVIGGLGSITGAAVAAVSVGLIQQYANYYASSGTGDLAVVLLLALTLLVRPGGLAPKVAH
jgi:branched-chain amino acid transport system permease protein